MFDTVGVGVTTGVMLTAKRLSNMLNRIIIVIAAKMICIPLLCLRELLIIHILLVYE